MINTCDECLNRQLKIDALTEENLRLKQKLRYRELKEKEGFFGSSTPSAKIPVKANAPATAGKPKGARLGHKGKGRSSVAAEDADETISVFQFRTTRSAKAPQAVFGTEPLQGVLVVDRYAGYNKVPCLLQYCYAHLLREVEDLGKEFSDDQEVKRFVSVMASLLSAAMGLRNQPISDKVYYNRAAELKTQLQAAVQSPAQHLGIRRIQDIFHEQAHRLYHWVSDRRVPAENNLAERDLRPTVIACKVSFGSFSDAGAHTRGVLMSVLHSLKKQAPDVAGHLKSVLDQIVQNPTQDPFPLLFPLSACPHRQARAYPRLDRLASLTLSSAIQTVHEMSLAEFPLITEGIRPHICIY